jgi:hypothetical protein
VKNGKNYKSGCNQTVAIKRICLPLSIPSISLDGQSLPRPQEYTRSGSCLFLVIADLERSICLHVAARWTSLVRALQASDYFCLAICNFAEGFHREQRDQLALFQAQLAFARNNDLGHLRKELCGAYLRKRRLIAANFAACEQLCRLVVHNCPAKPYLFQGFQIKNRPFRGARV